MAQLHQQLRELFWVRLRQIVQNNTHPAEAVSEPPLWSRFTLAKLQKRSFARDSSPFPHSALGRGAHGRGGGGGGRRGGGRVGEATMRPCLRP
jgi:hypothetical protein